ncbi:hypothetical protein PHAVU_006G005600 [Phaseolus vulgaris]|uniref:Uncharacterized protein n=1 Tax=Phaseolus vulgaris TaxID=3885 RepID=V7BLU9_PHAVU|nr:hypothetical protein PHAVU_006G005600g [Phaseolus vulgaris]ESW18008.1 hypothetical protein PHAVU_006G005600g [Phaseolus vulgaris]
MMALGIWASNPPASDVAADSSFSQNVHSKNVVKNALGSRIDMAWKHGACLNGDPRKIQCKFFQKTITGGVYRWKHHFVGLKKDAIACKSVTEAVKRSLRLLWVCSKD